MGNRIMFTGLGFAHPETFVTTEELCRYLGIPEWAERFEQMFLMHKRPLWWENGMPKKVEWPGTTLAVEAGQQALRMAGVPAKDVTHLFYISCTPDVNYFQADVYRIMQQLGLVRASALHFNLGCGGLAPALYYASVLLSVGAARQVLIVGANSTSPFLVRSEQHIKEKEWFSAAMFNDSAGAVLVSAIPDHRVGSPQTLRKTVPHTPVYEGVERQEEPDTFAHCFIADDEAKVVGNLLTAMCMESGAEPLMHVAGGGANDPNSLDVLFRLHSKAVGERYGPVMLESVEILTRETPAYHPTRAKLTAVHQANGNVVKQLRRALNLDQEPERLPVRTWDIGNSVAASTIEILLDAVNNRRLKDGDIVAIVTIGAGMSTGGACLRWRSP